MLGLKLIYVCKSGHWMYEVVITRLGVWRAEANTRPLKLHQRLQTPFQRWERTTASYLISKSIGQCKKNVTPVR